MMGVAFEGNMMLKLLLLLALSGNKVSLREYCDQEVYYNQGSPNFKWHPQSYILPYYKRCMNHEGWAACITQTRKTMPARVSVQDFEKNFPSERNMVIAGLLFCDLTLLYVPPNKTNCVFNHTMCNEVYESKFECRDSVKKASCIWGQLSKCGIDQMQPIHTYELGLLGGACLKEEGIPIAPYTREIGAACDPNSGETVRASHFLPVITCIVVFVLSTTHHVLNRPM